MTENATTTDDSAGTIDALRPFSTEEDREQLKQAILECTRDEVVRALNEILGEGICAHSNPENDAALRSQSKQAAKVVHHSSVASRLYHQQRPKSVQAVEQTGGLQINRRQRSNTSHSNHVSQALSLESVGDQVAYVQIDRYSSNLLQRSSAIITKATGEPPKKYNECLTENANGSLDVDNGATTCGDKNESSERMQGESHDIDEATIDGLQRVDSWPDRFRPTTATRLIHTSHSVLSNKPSSRRPLTTTALERRKPPPSTAASERNKAQEFSKRLLGPITLKRPNYDFMIPNSLVANEWENELARNIINVFSNKARSEINGEPSPQPVAASDTAVQELPPMIASNSLFSDSSKFQGINDELFMDEEERDFQRISISRESSGIGNSDSEFFVESPDKYLPTKTKKRGLQNGTFRLKMIWFTGTGMVRANWEVINEVGVEDLVDSDELSLLEEQGRYMRYVCIVESSILRWNSKTLQEEEHSNLKEMIWRQLIVTCNYFATRLIEKRKYPKAMEMLEKSISLIGSELGFLPEHICEELTAVVKDTYAYYYIRRSKPSASYQYLISAINIYKRRNDALNVAKCRIHQSFIQCAQHKYSNSMASLRKILTMVENGALDMIESDYNQVLLLASVAYHNIAVQQLMLGHISDACVSSQNARRLARLCLSVSSHYLPMLESTHKQSLNELSSVLKNSHCEEQALLFQNLISELFD